MNHKRKIIIAVLEVVAIIGIAFGFWVAAFNGALP